MINTAARVLVADDSLTIATALALSIRRAGFDVTTTHSGEDALRLARASQYNLVISDQQMLEMSGVELCGHLRATGAYREIPFILLTASSELDVNQLLADPGVTSVLGKPFKPSAIVSLVKQLTAEKAPSSA